MDTLAPKTRGCQFSTEAEHLKYYSRWFGLIDDQSDPNQVDLDQVDLDQAHAHQVLPLHLQDGVRDWENLKLSAMVCLYSNPGTLEEIFKKYIKGTWPDCQTQRRYAGGDTEVFKRNQRLIISPPCKARGRFLASWRSWGISRDLTVLASPIVSSPTFSTHWAPPT